jgi:hypothetical protein
MRHQRVVTAIKFLALALVLGFGTSAGAFEARFSTLAAQGTGSFRQWLTTPVEITITSQLNTLGTITATALGNQTGTTFTLPVTTKGTIPVSGAGLTGVFAVNTTSLTCGGTDTAFYLVVKTVFGTFEGTASRWLQC